MKYRVKLNEMFYDKVKSDVMWNEASHSAANRD